jgi:hypothetical protein
VVYKKYRAPFLSDIPGAESKKLLIRNEDVHRRERERVPFQPTL